MIRIDGRKEDELRKIKITRRYLKYAEGSVLIECGDTKVICAATIEDKVPHFMKGSGKGWITAEYSLLPRSTQVRNSREASRGKQTGRTQEIQLLIGLALRSIVDLELLGEKTIWIECDVLQADGGTRTASITGAFIALVEAVASLKLDNGKAFPIRDFLAAVSVGVLDETTVLDLCYAEDSNAVVDMNIVMTGKGEYVEVQGTGEEHPFTRQQLAHLLALGEQGVADLIKIQQDALGDIALKIGSPA